SCALLPEPLRGGHDLVAGPSRAPSDQGRFSAEAETNSPRVSLICVNHARASLRQVYRLGRDLVLDSLAAVLDRDHAGLQRLGDLELQIDHEQAVLEL